MGKSYCHMNAEERAVLQVELDRGTSLRAIARRLGRSAGTLSREVRRQSSPVYSAAKAGNAYRVRRRRSVRGRKLVEGTALLRLPEMRIG
jgi:IS30 family transposase